MGLTCDCGWVDYDFYYDKPADYSILTTKRGRRCRSCGALIKVGETVACFPTWRNPHDDVEERIYGEEGEVWLAPWYFCETCADLFFSLDDLGFCITLGNDSMQELVRQYAETYGRTT